MTPNAGIVGRYVRIAIGLALLALVFVGPKTLWGLVGLVPFVTALARCPAYRILGVNTCRAQRQ